MLNQGRSALRLCQNVHTVADLTWSAFIRLHQPLCYRHHPAIWTTKAHPLSFEMTAMTTATMRSSRLHICSQGPYLTAFYHRQ
jgi:hypothetical protein